MGKFWKKLLARIKLTLFACLVAYLAAFIWNNYDQPATFWVWFRVEPKTTTLKLSTLAFIAGALAMVLVYTTVKTLSQLTDRPRPPQFLPAPKEPMPPEPTVKS